MLLDNINSNLVDMIEMVSNLQYYKKRNKYLEITNAQLSENLSNLTSQNDQMSINILKDQEIIAELKTSLQECREDVIKNLQTFDSEKKKLNKIIKELEKKNEENLRSCETLKISNEELLLSKSNLMTMLNEFKSK